MARLRSDSTDSGNPMPAISTDRRRRPKIIVSLNDDGRPDVSSLTDDAREKLRAALEEAAPEPPPPIEPAVVAFGLQALARIEAAVVGPRFGLDADTAAACLVPQPPLSDQLAAAGARVLNKYSGAWSRYQDEIVLGALLITWQAGALQALRAAAAERAHAEEGKSPEPEQSQKSQPEAVVLTERLEDWT